MSGVEKRKSTRHRLTQDKEVRLSYESRPGVPQSIVTRLLDLSETGCGILSPIRLRPGALVSLSGVHRASSGGFAPLRATVAWSQEGRQGQWRIGITFHEPISAEEAAGAGKHGNGAGSRPGGEAGQRGQESPDASADYYEILQLSPNATPETIHRVYRIMAQRFHPDNRETGNEAAFRTILEAYRTLSDPELRASYDARLESLHRDRWKVFQKAGEATGTEGEKNKRHAILALLYTKRLHQPEQPGVTVQELEYLMGCPREHLQFALWYLREQGWLERSDNGRHAITIRGVDQAEQAAAPQPLTQLLLNSAGSRDDLPLT